MKKTISLLLLVVLFVSMISCSKKRLSFDSFIAKYQLTDISVLKDNPKEFIKDFHALIYTMTWKDIQSKTWKDYDEGTRRKLLFLFGYECLFEVDFDEDKEKIKKLYVWIERSFGGPDIYYWEYGKSISKELISLFGNPLEIKANRDYISKEQFEEIRNRDNFGIYYLTWEEIEFECVQYQDLPNQNDICFVLTFPR